MHLSRQAHEPGPGRAASATDQAALAGSAPPHPHIQGPGEDGSRTRQNELAGTRRQEVGCAPDRQKPHGPGSAWAGQVWLQANPMQSGACFSCGAPKGPRPAQVPLCSGSALGRSPKPRPPPALSGESTALCKALPDGTGGNGAKLHSLSKCCCRPVVPGGGKGDPSPSQLPWRSVPGRSQGDQSPPPNARTLLAAPSSRTACQPRAPERGAVTCRRRRRRQRGARNPEGSKQAQGSQMAKVPPQSSRIWDVCTNPISGSLQVFLQPVNAAHSTAVKGAAGSLCRPAGSDVRHATLGGPCSAPPPSRAPPVPAAPLPDPGRIWRASKTGLAEARPCPTPGDIRARL